MSILIDALVYVAIYILKMKYYKIYSNQNYIKIFNGSLQWPRFLTLSNSISCKEDSSSRTHLLFIIHYLLKNSSEQSCQTYNTTLAPHVGLYFFLLVTSTLLTLITITLTLKHKPTISHGNKLCNCININTCIFEILSIKFL